MSLQIIGLNRCTACDSEDVIWACPACGWVVPSDVSEEEREVVGLEGVRCGGCGASKELVTYVVPDALTDFWIHEIRSAERIRKVDFSAEMGRPTALHLRSGVIGVERMVFFLRVSDAAPAFGPAPHGAYVLHTELGLCVIVSVPHEIGEGEFNEAIADWYLIDAEIGMRERLSEPLRTPERRRLDQNIESSDEGLLRNSHAYRIVYRIENAFRNLLSSRLMDKSGRSPRWWEAAVPQQIREQVDEVERRRKDSAWFELPRAERMELTTLGQLRGLLEGDWNNLGRGLGPKEVILGALRKVEFYRNELAHCRPLTLRMLSDLNEVERSLARIAGGRGGIS